MMYTKNCTIVLLVSASLLALPAFASKAKCEKFTVTENEIKREVTFDISATQLIVGAIVTIAITKIIFGTPGAFTEVEVPPGWTSDTDGKTFLEISPPSPITEPTTFEFSWLSVPPSLASDISQSDLFSWSTLGSPGPTLVESASVGSDALTELESAPLVCSPDSIPAVGTPGLLLLALLLFALLTAGAVAATRRRRSL